MTLREIRRAGIRAVFSRRWFGRTMFVTAVLYAVQCIPAAFFVWARKGIGFMSWNDFLQSKLAKTLAGIDYAVPSQAVARSLTYASAFEVFVSCVVGGLFAYGATAFALRMVRDDPDCGYTAGAFGGFARPLGLAWLVFRMQVQIALWSLLFLVPGVIAWYRYRAAFYLKVENPDWSAGRCLAESGRVMRGHKRRCFALDCSYWLILTLLFVLVGVAASFAFVSSALSLLAPLVLLVVASLVWCVFAGQTIFYLSITSGNKESPAV